MKKREVYNPQPPPHPNAMNQISIYKQMQKRVTQNLTQAHPSTPMLRLNF